MKFLICLSLFTVALAWPQYVIERSYNEPAQDTINEDQEEILYNPADDSEIDPGLFESVDDFSGPVVELEEGGPSEDDNVPDILVIDEELPMAVDDNTDIGSEYRPSNSGGYDFPSIFSNNPFRGFVRVNLSPDYNRPIRFPSFMDENEDEDEDESFYNPPPRRSQRPNLLDLFTRDLFKPHYNPMTPFSFDRPQQPMLPSIFQRPQFPGFSRRPIFESDLPREDDIDNDYGVDDTDFGVDDTDFGLEEEEQSYRPVRPVRPVRPHSFNHGNFFNHFFRPHFGNSFGFPGITSKLPDNYSNSTHRVEDINGTKVSVNETIHKKTGDGFNSFFHFKIIHPYQDEQEKAEEEEVTTAIPFDDAYPTEEAVVDNEVSIGGEFDFNTESPEVEEEEYSPDETATQKYEVNEVIPSADSDNAIDYFDSFDFGNVKDNEILSDNRGDVKYRKPLV